MFTLFLASSLQAEKRWVLKGIPEEYPSFEPIKCIDSLNCVTFVGTVDHSSIYKSTDQGDTWFKFSTFNRNIPKFDSIRTIYHCLAYDSLQMYMIFTEGAVLEKSIDAGKTFKRVYFEELYLLNSVERLYAVAMYNKQLGASITRTHLIYTRDNWDTYTLVPRPDSIFSGDPIFFIDSNNIAVLKYVTNSEEFMQYNISNDEWSQYNIGEEIPEGEDKRSINHLSFVSHNLIYACGHQFTGVAHYSKDLVWKSTDRGKTWIKLMDQLNDPGFGLRRVAFKDEKNGIVVGSWGKILETTDGGESWYQHPFQDEMRSLGSEIEWAGEYAIYGSISTGIFRLETVTDVEEISSNDKFRVYQSGDNLEIAINDESHATYSFSLYNSSGQSLMTRNIKSSYGFVFEPVELIDLTNGVYLYTVSKNNSVEFNGKLVVVE